jgi:hypothetical protein
MIKILPLVKSLIKSLVKSTMNVSFQPKHTLNPVKYELIVILKQLLWYMERMSVNLPAN